jgi:lysyl-tRNA synthetase class 2
MSELDEQIQNRREKRDRLKAAGQNVYPHRFDVDAEPTQVHAKWGHATAEELAASPTRLKVPGRVRGLREHGKSIFIDLHDGVAKLQLFVRRDKLDEASQAVLASLDLGDFIGASGELMRTRLGELSLMVDGLALLAKALRPLPEKWHGLSDIEVRYRQRYLDLATNRESRQVFEVRAAIIGGLRDFLNRHGFLEVETPMMQALPGGATARPFRTHHNALDLDLYLRIAPELYLKRLIVGGLGRVYEINRNFRNEGISTRHNPEFTMLEFYWAYADYHDVLDLTEEMISAAATKSQELLGTSGLSFGGTPLDFTRPWARYTMREAVIHFTGLPPEVVDSAEALRAELISRHVPMPPSDRYGNLLVALFEATVEPHLVQPTFILDHPVEVSPLAKECPGDARFTERFELYIAGMELANAFSELNDPEVQADRFRGQLAAREKGDAEAHLFDADYVQALEHGMPPAGGCGVGIDRLTMILTDRSSIRDVILFPLLKPGTPLPSTVIDAAAEPGAADPGAAES